MSNACRILIMNPILFMNRLLPRWLSRILPLCVLLFATAIPGSFAAEVRSVPILAYHRFADTAVDSMTMRNEVFVAQIKYLHDQGYTVVPLRQVVNALQGRGAPLPPKPVVITVDDGHRSVFSDMRPVIEREKIPVTLFIYPSAISNAAYAMTWPQLAELRDTGLFDIQSHTYWHPNFKIEKRRLSPEAYQTFVRTQLEKSRATLKKHLGGDADIDMLAWPFGIYDEELMAAAHAAGYVAAFSIDSRHARASDRPLALPRLLMVDAQGMKGFINRLKNEGGE